MRRITRNRVTAISLLAVVGALIVGPGTAFAQDALSNPSAAQYTPQSQVQGTATNGGGGGGPTAANTSTPTASTGSSTGTLPFTGMDAVVLGVVALALIGTGVALRRLSTPKAPRI
jgi:hypothetical protein